jgi:hypothetical protein
MTVIPLLWDLTRWSTNLFPCFSISSSPNSPVPSQSGCSHAASAVPGHISPYFSDLWHIPSKSKFGAVSRTASGHCKYLCLPELEVTSFIDTSCGVMAYYHSQKKPHLMYTLDDSDREVIFPEVTGNEVGMKIKTPHSISRFFSHPIRHFKGYISSFADLQPQYCFPCLRTHHGFRFSV